MYKHSPVPEKKWGGGGVVMHSGSAVGSVVGRMVPQYCLFDDTLNTYIMLRSNLLLHYILLLFLVTFVGMHTGSVVGVVGRRMLTIRSTRSTV